MSPRLVPDTQAPNYDLTGRPALGALRSFGSTRRTAAFSPFRTSTRTAAN